MDKKIIIKVNMLLTLLIDKYVFKCFLNKIYIWYKKASLPLSTPEVEGRLNVLKDQ